MNDFLKEIVKLTTKLEESNDLNILYVIHEMELLYENHIKHLKNSDISIVKQYEVKIDDTTTFGCPHNDHERHRVYIDGLKYGEAVLLQKIISNIIK